jgi:hypothetical protein
LVALTDKNRIDDKADKSKGTALIQHEPIHYHILPPNEPHPCDMYECPREAKYKLGTKHYCDDKMVSHFREVAEKCQIEGFELIKDLQ